jgi:hypothetical protein
MGGITEQIQTRRMHLGFALAGVEDTPFTFSAAETNIIHATIFGAKQNIALLPGGFECLASFVLDVFQQRSIAISAPCSSPLRHGRGSSSRPL